MARSLETIDGYVAAQPEPLRSVGATMVPIIEAVLPGAGAVWHGHPVWSLGAVPGRNPVCLLKAYPAYLTFGLWRGRELADSTGRMHTGTGMAHVKLRSLEDIDAQLFTAWLARLRALEQPPAPRTE